MKLIDISMPIAPDMPVYKNRAEKTPRWLVERTFETDGFRESALWLNLHTGTHVDAPLHFIEGGGDIASIPPERFVGTCRVLDASGPREAVTSETLESLSLEGVEFLLFKTRNSLEDRPLSFVYLEASAARILAGLPLKAVGIDALGIERDQPGHPTHRLLLEKGILIIEGLDLRRVSPGDYGILVMPLPIAGGEAAPARAFLVRELSEWRSLVYNEEKIER